MTQMTQVTQVNTSTNGNTTRIIRARYWQVVINNPSIEDIEKWKSVINTTKRSVWQFETGTNGTLHIQGHIEFKNAMTNRSLKKKLGNSAHLEKVNNRDASIEYCQKPETRTEGPWLKGFPKPIKIISTMRPWQQKILDLLAAEANDRTINWVVDTEGSSGKTALCKYIITNYNALYLTGKASDMKYLITQYLEQDPTNADNLICLFDYTRSVETFVSYQGIEEIKNGIFTNTKYEVKMVIFNSPHVFVFSNFTPLTQRLSKDRWNIINLNE